MTDRALAHETKLAMFCAAVVADCADETYVTGRRLVASLVRTASVRAFCSRAEIDLAPVFAAVDDPEQLSFAECERRVWRDLSERGVEFASNEHAAGIQERKRPLEPTVRGVIDAVIDRYGQLGAPPLELLLDLIRLDPALVGCLSPHGLTAESIRAALEEQ